MFRVLPTNLRVVFTFGFFAEDAFWTTCCIAILDFALSIIIYFIVQLVLPLELYAFFLFCAVLCYNKKNLFGFLFVEVNPLPIFPLVTAVVNFQLGFTNQFGFKLNTSFFASLDLNTRTRWTGSN